MYKDVKLEETSPYRQMFDRHLQKHVVAKQQSPANQARSTPQLEEISGGTSTVFNFLEKTENLPKAA